MKHKYMDSDVKNKTHGEYIKKAFALLEERELAATKPLQQQKKYPPGVVTKTVRIDPDVKVWKVWTMW